MATATIEKTTVKITDYVTIQDASDATWAYLNDLDEDQLRAELYPYIRNVMASLQRARVRAVEDEVFSSEDGTCDLIAQRMRLITEWFPLPSGRRVSWLEATAAEHRERAEYQRRLAGKCVVDAERHEQAADLIESHKVTCLMEIES
jgi:hypothetical protein